MYRYPVDVRLDQQRVELMVFIKTKAQLMNDCREYHGNSWNIMELCHMLLPISEPKT